MSIIKPLPHWAIINGFPSFYDTESLTAIEQTARLYGKVKELIETYNRYVTEMNGELTELETQVQKDLACAIRTIINLTDAYITQTELRLNHQDRKLDEAYKAFTEDITSAVDSIIRQMKEAGELDQVILDAVDNLNTKFETYTSGVADEQAALRADYEATKQAMLAEYDGFVANISSEYARKQTELTNTVDNFCFAKAAEINANTYFRTRTSKVLAEITTGDGVGYGVPEIGEYSLVGVLLRNGDYCICRVEHHENGQYYVRGTGYGDGGAVYTAQYPVMRFSTVDMALNADGDIVSVRAGYMRFLGLETGIEFTKAEILISRIDGLVLNGNIIY